MSTAGAVAGRRTALGSLVRRRPEWWVWPIAAAGWLAMLALHQLVPAGVGTPEHAAHAAHAAHGMPGHHGSGGMLAATAWLLGWTAMVLAMMLPVATPLLYRVAVDSMRPRRGRAIALTGLAFVGVWTAAGVAVGALLGLSYRIVGPIPDGSRTALAAGLLAVAAGFELTRAKQRALRRCGLGQRIPPRGPAADRGCLRAGAAAGTACLASCGLMMAALAVAGHAMWPLMLVITAVIWTQRLLVINPRLSRWSAAAALILSAIAVAIG